MSHDCKANCPKGWYQGDPDCKQCLDAGKRLRERFMHIVPVTKPGDASQFKLPDLRGKFIKEQK